jgi:hypothetical protein
MPRLRGLGNPRSARSVLFVPEAEPSYNRNLTRAADSVT